MLVYALGSEDGYWPARFEVIPHSTHGASAALALSSVWLAGPTLALKVQGACHTLSATSLSEVALRRTCTESIRKKSTLKTALTKKKTKFALSTLGVIYFLIYLPNYRKKLLQRRPRQPLLPHPIMMLRSLRMMS